MLSATALLQRMAERVYMASLLRISARFPADMPYPTTVQPLRQPVCMRKKKNKTTHSGGLAPSGCSSFMCASALTSPLPMTRRSTLSCAKRATLACAWRCTEPEMGVRSPSISFTSVDLPCPFAPTSATRLPCSCNAEGRLLQRRPTHW